MSKDFGTKERKMQQKRGKNIKEWRIHTEFRNACSSSEVTIDASDMLS